MNNYLIYKFTSPSGKSYIGQTNRLKRRIVEHQSIRSECSGLSRAIQKYGWDNFIIEIIADNLSLEDANILEVYYINEHNTLSPYGYNLKNGGLNYSILPETKLKMSQSHKGIKFTDDHKQNISNSLKGRIFTDEHKQNISNACKGREITEHHKQIISESNKNRTPPMLGKHHTSESIEKRQLKRKGMKWKIDPISGKRKYYFPSTQS